MKNPLTYYTKFTLIWQFLPGFSGFLPEIKPPRGAGANTDCLVRRSDVYYFSKLFKPSFLSSMFNSSL